jgi:rsbT co-antagonist protein RsbR
MSGMASTIEGVYVALAPGLTSIDPRSLKDLWSVYEAHYDQINEDWLRDLPDDPDFGPRRVSPSPEVLKQQSRRAQELLGRAMLQGEWEPYLEDLHEQGVNYARTGQRFVSWFRALSTIRPLLKAHLRAAYEEPERRFHAIDALDTWFDVAMSIIGDGYLHTKQETIIDQQEAIRELSTPVLTLMDGLLLLPVVGVLDSHRARQMTDQLLKAIHRHRAKVVVIDITGVAAVDSMVANHLIQAVEAARLLGSTAVVTGLSAEVAQTVVKIGVDLGRLRTIGDLQGGVAEAARLLGYRFVQAEPGDD